MQDQIEDVRWVASQPVPALRALIREAEHDKIHRQSHPDHPSSSPPPRPFPPLSRAPPPPPSSSSTALKPAYLPREEEPEAVAFVELLKDAFKKLDENSLKKQRLAARGTHLTKTYSTSAITSHRGRPLAKTASLDPAVAKSVPSHKSASAPLPASTAHDTPMQHVIDLTETDTDWDRPSTSRADTTMCMEIDDNDSDSPMDASFFRAEPPPQTRVPPPKPKPQPEPSQSRSSAQTQRTRTGPPPLGMRRAPLLQPSQYTPSQGTKSVNVPRFKPPLLTNTARTANKSGSGTKPVTITSSKPPPRGGATKVAVAPKAAQKKQDPDSSFDVSFDMDVDALEEAMKAYD